MDALLKIDRAHVLAVTKTTNAHILAFSFIDGVVEPKWVLRDASLNILSIKDLPYLEKMLVGVSLETQSDGRVKVSFSMPLALDDRDLFFCQLPQNFEQTYGVVFDDLKYGPSYIKEVFVDIEASVSYCRCVVLASGQDFIEKIDVNLGPLKGFL